MKKLPLLLIIMLAHISILYAQNTFNAVIRDKESGEPLAGVNAYLPGTKTGGSSDTRGFVRIDNIPDGQQQVTFDFIGYEQQTLSLSFPLQQDDPLDIWLEHHHEETEEVIILSTRSSRTIADNPTRVEAISGEELSEKSNMKPGDIRMLLNESTGIQTQQTSATSYNSSIRIQGLDGKYTQILKDGYPLYAGFSGGLSLLQIVPLDLQQVEVVKGASSTLYGGGAIAGLVNLISKTPSAQGEISAMLNATSALGFDASTFYSQKHGSLGTTIFSSYNLGTPYDPADIGLTAIPEFERYTINPKMFWDITETTQLSLGFNTIIEDRTGGDIKKINNEGDSSRSYFENNRTTRFSTLLGLELRISENAVFKFKNSISYYDRRIAIPDFKFAGEQLSSFSEATYTFDNRSGEWIFGLNNWTDRFKQDKPDITQVVDYDHITWGLFVQNLWIISSSLSWENGLRYDHQDDYGSFILPRTALLVSAEPLTMRLGGGLGYKTPTVFNEDAERRQFRNVLPIDADNTRAEESMGLNLDVNYRSALWDALTLNINHMFFYTRVNDPLVLSPADNDFYVFRQPDGFIDTRGMETNIKFTYDHYKLFIGYTLADVKQHYDGSSSRFPLVARHRLNNVLMYEIHEDMRIGLEAYYTGRQRLNDGRYSKDYWIMGLMTEKIWPSFSLFLNFENFLDTRQTRFEKIYDGSVTDPQFRDIYAPLDGFVINGGIKIKL